MRNEAGGRLVYLDFLRGIAALMVIVIHVSRFVAPTPIPVEFTARGVQLFYVLSAYTLLLRNYDDSKTFLIKRFFRIAPLYYSAIIFYNWSHLFHWKTLLAFFFIDTRVVPFSWSISVEILFYLMFPILAKKINSLTSAIAFTCITFISGTIVTLIFENTYFTDYWFTSQLPVFGLGFVLYHLSGVAVFPVVAVMIAIGLLLRDAAPSFAAACLFVVLIWMLSNVKMPRWLGLLGLISYSTYLTHAAVMPLVKQWSSNNYGLGLMLTVGGTIVVATITYHLIEKPGISLGRKVINQLRQPQKVLEA
ncbi:acyltransferase [Leptolyngbya sp. FACHB-36]|uniref:acyltransferase family protein n=1 Tax=Leptolyngbya sp. FACHB-36 TaxID=2692808 RepID=UPI0024118D8E|nr:acyltransferase [Leptolyngbya sp. FACHB-36]